jgi:hypothetical protein
MKYKVTMARGKFLIVTKQGEVVFESHSLESCESWLDQEENRSVPPNAAPSGCYEEDAARRGDAVLQAIQSQ